MGLVHLLFHAFQSWQGAIFVFLVLLLLFSAPLRRYRWLAHIAGPRLAAVSELWLLNAACKGDFHLVAENLLREYGSPVRISPNMILTDDPDIIKCMTAPRSLFRRGHWYRGMQLDPRINNTLSEQDERRHNDLRSKLLPGYTGKDLPTLEERIDARVLELVGVMHRYATSNKKVDFAHVSQYLALDILTDIAFGKPFGFLIEERDLFMYIQTSAAFLPFMELGTNHPWIHAILTSKLLSSIAGPKPTDSRGLGAVIGVAQKVIEERYHGTSETGRDRDLLDSFMERGLTQIEAEAESLLQILAGADSAATCIRMTLLFLLVNPRAYQNLRTEISCFIKAGKVSFPVVRNNEASKMPYLQACIKESLRLWVPLNGLNTKVAPAEGIEVKGIHIPGGTEVAHAHHSMMRRREIFGENADIFYPERWLGDCGDALQKRREDVWHLSFSHGRFACLGKPIALMELNKVFVELLRRFDFGLVNAVQPIRTKCRQIHIQEGMWISVWPAA